METSKVKEELSEVFIITFFSKVEPEILAKNLTSIRFTVNQKNKDIYWQSQFGEYFIIKPFKYQGKSNGYRIMSNYPITTILYLIDGAFSWINMIVSGIELTIPIHKNKQELLSELTKRPTLILKDSRGIFTKDDIGIVLLQDKVIIQRRTKIKKLKEELKKIEVVRNDLFPNDYDLFTFLKNEESAG